MNNRLPFTALTLTLVSVISLSQSGFAAENTGEINAANGKRKPLIKRVAGGLLKPFKKEKEVTTASAKDTTTVAVAPVEKTNSAVLAEEKALDAIPENTSQPEEDVAKKPSAADIKTAQAASNVPGVNVPPNLMAQPVLDPPIKGFHPIKRIMRPVENLAKQSVMLGQQIMRLEGPIASLQPSMLQLEERMTGVKQEMGSMQTKLGAMQTQVAGVRGDMHSISGQMGGVRGDLGGMRTQIVELQGPIKDLQAPIERLEGPIQQVAQPVSGVQRQLADVDKNLAELKTLLSTVLLSIYVAAAAVCFGTPLAGFLIYKNRHKLFPN